MSLESTATVELGVERAEPMSPRSLLPWLKPFVVLGLLFLFLVAVSGLSDGVKGLGKGSLEAVMIAAANPFMGLVVGILGTTLVQSSSVTTAMIVGMVAGGVLPFETAIPMIMGANIGTTVTNTIAALAQIGHKNEFRRAFAAATCHDFFNYLTVLVLLPLELATGFLAKTSAALNGLLPAAGIDYDSPLKAALKSGVGTLEAFAKLLTSDKTVASVILIVLSLVLIFATLGALVKVMKSLLLGRAQKLVNRVLSRSSAGGAASIAVGIGVTAAVQSSSITTSMLVPLAGSGFVRLWQVFPVTVGANIGTTITALLACLAVSGDAASAARQIALVHLLFNLAGMALFYVPRPTRRLPMVAAMSLAKLAVAKRGLAFAYVALMFYVLPAALVFATR